MKLLRLARVVFLALCVVYLWNACFLISTLSTTSHPQLHLQPPPPSVSRDRDRHLKNEIISPPPIPVYTKELASQAIRPAPWTCGDNDSTIDTLTHQKPLFAFVHIYKTAGSSIRLFFQVYSHICKRGWMCVIGCTKVKPSSIQSDGGNWNKCRVKNVLTESVIEEEGMEGRVYPTVNNTILREEFDILGGHFRIGTGDYTLKSTNNIHPVRYIIFLRDPMERFISGILYERKDKEEQTLDSIVELVKEHVRGSRKGGDYWGKSLTYLLTPGQAERFDRMASEFAKESTGLSRQEQFAEVKAKTAIDNLFKYNAIVGMTEHMDQSMDILMHVLLFNASEEQREQLEEYTNTTRNESKNGQVSTSSVLEELKKDEEFMLVFGEYVKYEKLINDYAMEMHLLQHEVLLEQTDRVSDVA